MTVSTVCILIVIILYMAIIIGVGITFAKKNKNTDDFYLGGRQLGPIVTAMSAEASDMSSWLLMGLPGVAYISGLADAGWTAIGLAIGTYVNWLVVAKRLRKYSQKAGNAITIPVFFKNRFNDNGNAVIGIAALAIFIFFVPYTGSGFAACGKLFSTLFGVDYVPAMIVSAVVIVLYTMLGGFLAASFTDLIQSIIMTIALIIVVVFGISVAGGIDNVISNAEAIPGYLSMVQSGDVVTKEASPYGILTIISTAAWGLGYFGMPHILLRFMAIKDENKIKLSRRIASIWVVISMAVAIVIGIIGYSMSLEGAIPSFTTTSEAETTIINIATLLSQKGVLLALLAGLILAGILACTMSTSDSQLLAASSSVSQNIFVDVFHVKLNEKQKLGVARITVVVIAIIGVIIAWNPENSVFKIVSFAWAGFGATFGPAMLFSLFWRRTNKWGVLAGMLSGIISIFLWKFLVRPIGGVFDIYELLPAFIISSLFILVISLVTAPPSKEVTDVFDEVAGKKKVEEANGVQ